MENNEIMNNEEVMETAVEVVKTKSNSFKVAAGIGLVALVGVLTYQYVAKPMIAKIKARRESQNADILTESMDDSLGFMEA